MQKIIKIYQEDAEKNSGPKKSSLQLQTNSNLIYVEAGNYTCTSIFILKRGTPYATLHYSEETRSLRMTNFVSLANTLSPTT